MKRFYGVLFFLLFINDIAAGEILPAIPHTLPFEAILPEPVDEYEIMQADSEGAREYVLSRSRLTADGFDLECKLGRCSSEDKPWLMIRHHKTLKGLAVLLAWPGNWRIEVKADDNGKTRLRASTWPDYLPQIEDIIDFPVPGCLVADFIGDWDNGAQPITRFIRGRLLRNLGPDWPWIQFNNYYDRYGVLQEDRLIESARQAARMGCELFVIDAGWFGPGVDWHDALGDWQENTVMLPNGVKPIADAVRSLGMKFGLWVEIEVASLDSQLVKDHPEWLLRSGGKLASQRSALNFGHPEVLVWAKKVIDDLVTAYSLDYIKMDFNTDLLVTGDRDERGNERLWAHYSGLADMWTEMRAKYPNLVIENCSGGSRRQDLFTAALTDTHWLSDEIVGEKSLAINFGATYLFPPEICSHWTCTPRSTPVLDLQSEFTVNMMGMLGFSGAILAWDDETLFHAADRVALYKLIRPWLRKSEVYHLTEQVDYDNPRLIQAAQYHDSANDRSLLFVFHGGAPEFEARFKLHGLDPEKTYRISMPPIFGGDATMKGGALAKGLPVKFPHSGASAVMRIELADKATTKDLPSVTNLKAAPISLDNARNQLALQLDWDAVKGAQRYMLYLAESGKQLRPVAETFINQYITAGLRPEMDYEIQIVAESFDGRTISKPSKIVTARTRSLFVGSGQLWAEPWHTDMSVPANANSKRNRAILGDRLSIGGKEYDFGIGTHAGAKFAFDVSRYPPELRRKFSATVGIDDCAKYNMKGEPGCVFVVAADRHVIYRSEKVTLTGGPLDIEVTLPPEARRIVLSVEAAEDCPFNHADWIEPRIE